jgi:ATP-dependent exoDNAse (exonuclease V) beta subunit
MSGVMGKKPTGKLAYLCEAFGIGADGRVGDGPVPFSLHRISTDEALMDAGEAKRVTVKTGTVSKGHNEMVYTETLHERYQPATLWRDVTEETDDIRTKHGDDWVALGRAFHAVFEGLSRGLITLDTLEERTQEILKNEMLSGDMEKMKALILSDIVHLESAGYLGDIILPQADSYAELPFILEVGRSIYKGRIDRIIRRDGIAHIYDYKTYPVSEKEIPELRERYAFQMGIYRKAVERLFSMEAKTHIFFTHAPAFLV